MTDSSDRQERAPNGNGDVPGSAQTPSGSHSAAAWFVKASAGIIALAGSGMGAFFIYWGVQKGKDDEMIIGGMVLMASLFGAAVTLGLASLLSTKR